MEKSKKFQFRFRFRFAGPPSRSLDALPCEDRSSESIFHSKWAYELSTALQLGNAEAIHNIPRAVRTHARPLGDVETDLPPPQSEAAASAHPGAEEESLGPSSSSELDGDSESESEPEE